MHRFLRENPGLSVRRYRDLIASQTGWRPSMGALVSALRRIEPAPRTRGRPRKHNRPDASALLQEAGRTMLAAFPLTRVPRRKAKSALANFISKANVLVAPVGRIPARFYPRHTPRFLDAAIVSIAGLPPRLHLLWRDSLAQTAKAKRCYSALLSDMFLRIRLIRRGSGLWLAKLVLSKRARAANHKEFIFRHEGKSGSSEDIKPRTAEAEAVRQQRALRRWVQLAFQAIAFDHPTGQRAPGKRRVQQHLQSLWRKLWRPTAPAPDASGPPATV